MSVTGCAVLGKILPRWCHNRTLAALSCDSIDHQFAAAWKHKPKDTIPTTLFGCYSLGNARVTPIVRGMSSAAIQRGFATRKQEKHTRTLAQNGVTASNTVYE